MVTIGPYEEMTGRKLPSERAWTGGSIDYEDFEIIAKYYRMPDLNPPKPSNIKEKASQYALTLSSIAASSFLIPFVDMLSKESGTNPLALYASVPLVVGSMAFSAYMKESGRLERDFPRLNRALELIFTPPYLPARPAKQ